MARARDNQRSRLYKADQVIYEQIDGLSVETMQQFVDSITDSAWWKQRFYGRRITVTDGRGRRKAYADPFTRVIKIPLWARSTGVILHEVAHIATRDAHGSEVAPHGPEFAGVFLALVKRFYGTKQHDKLLRAFLAHNVQAVPVS